MRRSRFLAGWLLGTALLAAAAAASRAADVEPAADDVEQGECLQTQYLEDGPNRTLVRMRGKLELELKGLLPGLIAEARAALLPLAGLMCVPPAGIVWSPVPSGSPAKSWIPKGFAPHRP